MTRRDSKLRTVQRSRFEVREAVFTVQGSTWTASNIKRGTAFSDGMKINKFEDIESWKEARILVKDIYAVFSDQIQRASISVMSNIAEGFDHGSNKEFIQFLVIARGSVSEVKSLTYAGLDIGYLSRESCQRIAEKCSNLSNMINGFLRYLKNSERKK